MADDFPTQPKKKRRPRAELEELMIQGGVDVLRELGVETQLSSVSYAKVFEHIEKTQGVRITYGSVHERIWNSLQEYQLAVIERAGVWAEGNDDHGWTDWLQTMVALSSTGAGETVTEAATAGARATYADRSAAHSPTDADPDSLLPAGMSREEAHTMLSIAMADGLRLRAFLTDDEAGTEALEALADAILARWARGA